MTRIIVLSSVAILSACALGPRRVALAGLDAFGCTRTAIVAQGYRIYKESAAKGILRAARTRTVGYLQTAESVQYEQDLLAVQLRRHFTDTLIEVTFSSGTGLRYFDPAVTGETGRYRAPTSAVTADADTLLARCGARRTSKSTEVAWDARNTRR